MYARFKYSNTQKAHDALLKKYGKPDGTVNVNKLPQGHMRIVYQKEIPPNFDARYDVSVTNGFESHNIGTFKTKKEALTFANGNVKPHWIADKGSKYQYS